MSVEGMIYELQEFDKRNKLPLPPLISKWRSSWIKRIEKQLDKQNRFFEKDKSCRGAWICK